MMQTIINVLQTLLWLPLSIYSIVLLHSSFLYIKTNLSYYFLDMITSGLFILAAAIMISFGINSPKGIFATFIILISYLVDHINRKYNKQN